MNLDVETILGLEEEAAALRARVAELEAALLEKTVVSNVMSHVTEMNLTDAADERDALRARVAGLKDALKAAKLALEYADDDELGEAIAAIDAALTQESGK